MLLPRTTDVVDWNLLVLAHLKESWAFATIIISSIVDDIVLSRLHYFRLIILNESWWLISERFLVILSFFIEIINIEDNLISWVVIAAFILIHFIGMRHIPRNITLFHEPLQHWQLDFVIYHILLVRWISMCMLCFFNSYRVVFTTRIAIACLIILFLNWWVRLDIVLSNSEFIIQVTSLTNVVSSILSLLSFPLILHLCCVDRRYWVRVGIV